MAVRLNCSLSAFTCLPVDELAYHVYYARDMAVKILGIETSCDETAVAVVEDGRRIRSNIVASQVALHSQYGGIVPEVASRQHLVQIAPTITRSLEEAGIALHELDAVAVTFGPGLAGSLLVGVNAAKALAFSLAVPFLGINHIEGHIYSAWLVTEPDTAAVDPQIEPGFPIVCLIASGGHTDLVLMVGHGAYKLLGRTRDDAAGEAFDKAARILGLGFPGGPEIQRVSEGVQAKEPLPRAWLKDTHDFSFSGVKTALLHRAQAGGVYPPGDLQQRDMAQTVGRMAADFQESLVDVMVRKTLDAAEKWGARGIILGGGVTANALLRERMLEQSPVPTVIPPPSLCTDNGSMIAACGYYQYMSGRRDSLDIDVDPALSL